MNFSKKVVLIVGASSGMGRIVASKLAAAGANSLAGFLGVPLQGPYSAAKGAVRLLTDTCRVEFAGYGIKFLSIYPGFVGTERTQDDGMPAPLEISEEKAADHILYALRKEKADYLFPLVMRWLIRLAYVGLRPIPPTAYRPA